MFCSHLEWTQPHDKENNDSAPHDCNGYSSADVPVSFSFRPALGTWDSTWCQAGRCILPLTEYCIFCIPFAGCVRSGCSSRARDSRGMRGNVENLQRRKKENRQDSLPQSRCVYEEQRVIHILPWMHDRAASGAQKTRRGEICGSEKRTENSGVANGNESRTIEQATSAPVANTRRPLTRRWLVCGSGCRESFSDGNLFAEARREEPKRDLSIIFPTHSLASV